MRTNAAVLVAMSFSGIAACKPMSGVYGAVRELREYKITKSYLEETSDANCGDEGVKHPLSPVLGAQPDVSV